MDIRKQTRDQKTGWIDQKKRCRLKTRRRLADKMQITKRMQIKKRDRDQKTGWRLAIKMLIRKRDGDQKTKCKFRKKMEIKKHDA